MENEIINRRRLIIILVVVTMVIFVGLVWLITTYGRLNIPGFQNPSATAGLQVAQNCTYPIAYWRDHPELYPAQIVIGGIVYKERELEALFTDDTQDQAQQIKSQLAVTFLNGIVGADQSMIESTVFEAYGWLVQHPTGSQVPEEELQAGRRLFGDLVAYNLGLSGVGPCEASLSVTETAIGSGTVTVELSLTPSQTETSTASETPTGQMTSPTSTLMYPTNTPVPTTEVPEYQPPTPTRTHPPPPTKTRTPVPPTPTKTSPPDTPTFTPPPPPTSTYTPPP